jgi:hypothetical protein
LHRWLIRVEVISGGLPGEDPAGRPRSNSPCPTASRYRTAALSASGSLSS